MPDITNIARYQHLNDKYGTVEGSRPWDATAEELTELIYFIEKYGIIDGTKRTAQLENKV
jgi:hypothetical protein